MDRDYDTCAICGSEDLELLDDRVYRCVNCNYISDSIVYELNYEYDDELHCEDDY